MSTEPAALKGLPKKWGAYRLHPDGWYRLFPPQKSPSQRPSKEGDQPNYESAKGLIAPASSRREARQSLKPGPGQ